MSANPLTVKRNNFKSLIEKAQESMAKVLPKHLNPERMLKVVLLAASREPLLYECTAESILRALMTCSELGLEPGGERGHLYLVPFWNKWINGYECQTIPGYRGLMHLARNTMDVSYFAAHVVHANDKFFVSYGIHEDLVHEPCMDDHPGVALGGYAVAFLKSGERQFEVMTRSQVESIKSRTKSRDKKGSIVGPWVSDEEEMWRKTAIRRLCKYLELSPEMVKAFEAEDEYEALSAPEKGVVDLGEILPDGPEQPPWLDLDTLRPADEEAPSQVVVEEPPPPVWIPETLPVKNQPKTGTGKIPPKTLKFILQFNQAGLTRSRLEAIVGSSAEDWGPEIIEVLQNVLPSILNGANAEKVLRAAFSLEGVAGV